MRVLFLEHAGVHEHVDSALLRRQRCVAVEADLRAGGGEGGGERSRWLWPVRRADVAIYGSVSSGRDSADRTADALDEGERVGGEVGEQQLAHAQKGDACGCVRPITRAAGREGERV